MKKVSTFILNHLSLLLGIVVFTVTFIVIGVVILNSYTSYKRYEKNFDKTDLDLRSLSPAEPKLIEIQDDFVTYKEDGSIKKNKSSYKNSLNVWADEFTVSQADALVDGGSVLSTYIPTLTNGGSISIVLTIEEKSFVDLDFVISSEYSTTVEEETVYGVTDLLSSVDFIINGETMEEEINLENDGSGPNWHHLVMAGFALPAGDITIQIKSQSNKGALMPELRNLTVFSSEVASIKEVA